MREAGAIILPIPSLVLILFEWAKLIDDALVEIGRWASSMPGNFEVNAVRVLTRAGDRVAVMVGRAGTGKTHTRGTLRTVYETAGWNVIGLAPAARAARELQDGAEITSTTIARHLVEQRGITTTTLVVVDEAAIADTLTTQPAWVIDHVRYLHGNQQLTATEPAEPAPESSQRLPTSTRTATSRLPGRRHRHLPISSALLASKSGSDT